ncbi:serine/threonine protein kinase [Nonomuraea candida]|uniref:serine/threonine protein kinase n=1 Tax=Nonomuraea candida TaxID=359159 RepID=UPI0006938B97|nr:serine/threonine-protein kinase [Nonomuraea candida]
MSELNADDPRRLGAYRLTRRLGQGGQGVVYLGESPQGAPVAVKLLHASLSGDPNARRRFLGEVEAVRKVAAFCTAQLLDADLEGDRPYLVSEYVEGPSLRELVVNEGPRQGGSLERLAIGTATALGAIHRAGVVHRDFKPGNVLLGIDGPRVIDFGVSRLVDTAVTTTHLPMGTPAYMAPERMKGESAGPPADMWAWALTVAYTATGRTAYTADTHQEVLARVLYGKPDLGPLDGRLREIVEACLAQEPGERPDAEEVLRRLLGQQAVGADVLSTGAMAAIGPDTGDAGGGSRRGAERRESGALAAVVGLGATEAEPGVITDPDPTTSFPAITAPLMAARDASARDASARDASARDSAAPDAAAPDAAAAQDASAVGVASRAPDTAKSHTADTVDTTRSAGTTLQALATGTPSGTSPAPVAGTPVQTAGPVWRRVRPWQVVVAVVGLVAAVAGFVFWLRGAQGPGLEGSWSGSAEHKSAGRVFPVVLHLNGDGGMMRWGADLHCAGRLSRDGNGMVFTLDRVGGEECYPGTLRMFPTSDVNQMDIKVTRKGKDEVTYSGKVARTS